MAARPIWRTRCAAARAPSGRTTIRALHGVRD